MYHFLIHRINRKTLSRVACLVFCLFLLMPKSMAQQSDTLDTYISLLKRNASQSYKKNQVYEAIYYYAEYVNYKPDDYKSCNRLAQLYDLTRNYPKAVQYYDTLIVHSEKKFPMSYYYAANALTSMEEYEQAIEYYTRFRKVIRGKKDPNNLRRLAGIKIKSCEWAILNRDVIEDITISRLPESINQPNLEFSPFPIDSSNFLYGSVRFDGVNVVSNYRQLFTATKLNGEWQFNEKFTDVVNQEYIHTGNAALSADGERIYFTRCEKNWRDKTICSIYKSNLEEGVWQEAEKLPYPINNENYTATQPTVGKNLRYGHDILYFVSDRPGTKGGMDIWYTEIDRKTNEYKEPKNLGRNVNTMGDDCTPYFDINNRTLYYSTKGREGFGGFDVYKTTGSAKKWFQPEALPKPINSPYDETYFVVLKANEGFFTSNRPGSATLEDGSCCDDIFQYRYNECIQVAVNGKVVNQTNFDVIDELNERYHLNLEYPEENMPLANIPVSVFLEDSTGEQMLISEMVSDEKGEYNLSLEVDKNYSLLIKNYGFFNKRVRVNTSGIKCSETLSAGITKINFLPEITVRSNVYYEHDKFKLNNTARATIDSLLPVFDLFPNAIIEIGSHTDNTGTDAYNETLSQKRSESVVKYLKAKGISSDRLIAKGYGESMPLAPNENPDGSDNPENRQLNRRTELNIVGELDTFDFDE